jgi:MoaA/NifB/PqqE/SkfB family radical SAM enzyme
MDNKTGLSRSGTLMLHLLGRCNLTCHHCYMHGGPSRTEQLRTESVIAAIGESATLGIGTLYLTGGEPFLYGGLDKVLGAASSAPELETVVCTNATLISERNASLLKSSGARVNVSIDGDEQFHDYFRNLAGSFKLSERGVQKLVDAGLSVTIVTTISQKNLHLLSSIAEWSARIGAEKFRVQPLLKLGRGLDITDQCLTSTQLNQLILELSDIANTFGPKLQCGMIGVTRRFLLAHPCGAYVCNGAGCHRRVAKEIKKVIVREDGTVLPEITNLSHEFALGNLDDGPLSVLVGRYFDDGYARFDQLCRSTYQEVLPEWQDAVVPWDQLVAERSYNWRGDASCEKSNVACGTCS